MRQRDIDKYNRESEARWNARFDKVSAKIGTVPMTIWVMNDSVLAVGNRIVFAEDINGAKRTGIITALEPRLFIDRL